MKVQVEVTEWWHVSYEESHEQYDQREGSPYVSWHPADRVFLTEQEALEFITGIKKNSRKITLAHVREF